jgi:hypothetical protein
VKQKVYDYHQFVWGTMAIVVFYVVLIWLRMATEKSGTRSVHCSIKEVHIGVDFVGGFGTPNYTLGSWPDVSNYNVLLHPAVRALRSVFVALIDEKSKLIIIKSRHQNKLALSLY